MKGPSTLGGLEIIRPSICIGGHNCASGRLFGLFEEMKIWDRPRPLGGAWGGTAGPAGARVLAGYRARAMGVSRTQHFWDKAVMNGAELWKKALGADGSVLAQIFPANWAGTKWVRRETNVVSQWETINPPCPFWFRKRVR